MCPGQDLLLPEFEEAPPILIIIHRKKELTVLGIKFKKK
jgi:hypothetical protein